MILYVMLVGRYPFERPEDARLADMARTQRTIQVRQVGVPSRQSACMVNNNNV